MTPVVITNVQQLGNHSYYSDEKRIHFLREIQAMTDNHLYQPLRSGRIMTRGQCLVVFSKFEFRVFLLLE